MDARKFKAHVSTHSRPKAAGASKPLRKAVKGVSTHSRPKAAVPWVTVAFRARWFQHTAARRRLVGANGVRSEE